MKNIRIMFGFILIVFGAQIVTGAPQPPVVSSDQPSAAKEQPIQEIPEKSVYLTDRVEITFRSGPGSDYRILAMLPLGQEVEILEVQSQWSKIRTETGREGWVSNRFIGREVPDRLLYDDLKAKFDQLSLDYIAMAEEAAHRKESNRELQNKIDSGVSVPQARLNQLFEENRHLKRMADKVFLQWFLAGAGVLLAGFLIGCWARREKRRSYLGLK